MRILAFSDLHRDAAKAEAIVNESRGADVVVGAGDFASCGLGHEDTLGILKRMTVPFVLVPGNHDDLGELFAACADWPLAHLLHGQSVVIGGVPFFGIGLGSGVIDPEPWNMVLDEGGGRPTAHAMSRAGGAGFAFATARHCRSAKGRQT